MKRVITLGMMVVAVAMMFGATAGNVTVTGVTAQQRYPWDGKVDIAVTISGTSNDVARAECVFIATNSATHAALNVSHITNIKGAFGSDSIWTRRFVWDAVADVGRTKVDDVMFFVTVSIGGVQLWDDGPYWAVCNVGAAEPEECGYYFWWGDTVGYKRNAVDNGWVSVKDAKSFIFADVNCPTYGMSNSQLQSAGCIDSTGNLVAKYDAATAHFGAPWRMPTDAEFSSLIANCDIEWTIQNGVAGCLVKGRGAYSAKSIFLAAAGGGYDSRILDLGSVGYYWSSTPGADYSSCARSFNFNSSIFLRDSNHLSDGQCIRPVRGFADGSGESLTSAMTHMALDCQVGSFNAAVVNITEGSTTGYTMTDGNTYVIQNSVSFSNSTVGGSGISVEDGATVVLYIPQGVTLTAIGANGEGRTGGGAGIQVPEASTLIITGEGTVIATGGNAGDGANGEDGANGMITHRYNDVAVPGEGGMGGNGGGGAGAGIGGCGGFGGTAATSVIYGGDGGNGSDGEPMGEVYVIGSMCVDVSAGSAGKAGAVGLPGSIGQKSSLYASGGGGGGGGGAGSPPACSIGGGGSAGGAGGHGTKGRESDKYTSPGVSGGGGASLTQNGGGSDASNRCKGGSYGNLGAEGTLHVASSASVNAVRGWILATTHPLAQYTITFDANDRMCSSESNCVIATLGCILPDCIPAPAREGYACCCWKDDNGNEYYDGAGTKMLSSYSVPSDVVLHAEWTIGPDALVVTPPSGTTFGDSLTVAMSCLVEGATIHYTLDGSDPTIDSTVYKKFKINGKITVKAIAFLPDGDHSDVVTASYALGRCADPIVSPGDGAVFKHSGQVVRIDQNGEEGVLRYTLDGTEPTAESPVYEGPFTVDDTTVVKAKVFSDRYFDSAVVTVNLTREWETVATPVITAAEEFTGSETKVVIACATTGATIRYTTDGGEPNSHSPKYTGPFWVDENCIVKAVAMCEDYLASKVASHTITKVWGIGDTMGAPDHAFATSGDAGFVRVEDVTAPKGEAMRSGAIGDSAGYGLYSRSILSTTVQGPCTLKFKWRCSCEEDDGFEWDHAEFAVDGEVKARINGIMDGWAEFTQVITEGGAHAVTWTYLKDDSEKDGADCLWVADYSWTPTELYTHESSVPVPYDWIRTYLPHTAYEYDHFEAAVRETAANGVNTVEETYVAGLDPSNPKDKFVAKIEMVDGKSVVTWTPDLNEDGTKSVRTYKTWGKDSLGADKWLEVTPENHDDMRFFKVTVGMP